jgi:hypothetical protein
LIPPPFFIYFIFSLPPFRGGLVHQVPFSDFLLTSMGYVQNEQSVLSTTRIKTFGLLVADRIDGPFELHVRRMDAVCRRRTFLRK